MELPPGSCESTVAGTARSVPQKNLKHIFLLLSLSRIHGDKEDPLDIIFFLIVAWEL